MSSLYFWVASAALVFFISKAMRNNQDSFGKESFRDNFLSKDNVKACGYDSLANAAVDPGTVTSNTRCHAPAVCHEEGPFGVPRQMRRERGTCVDIPTFGNHFFDQF